MLNIPDEVFEIGILNKDYHERLLADLHKYAAIAGIPVEFVWSKLSAYCTDQDLEWVRRMREGQDHGLIYEGTNFEVPIADKMMAITGACLRNYIDARFITVQDILQQLKDHTIKSPTLVLVPNFCMSKEEASSIAPWQAADLLGWLYSRMARDLKTVLYVGSMATLEKNYGEAMASHLKAHYSII